MPAKIIGEINWLMQPNYPKLSGEEGAETLEAVYFAGNDMLPNVLPDFDTKFDDYRWPFYSALDHLTLSDRTVIAMKGAYTYEVTLIYTVPPEMLQVSYQSPPFTVPIETLTGKYKTKWNYGYAYDEANGDGRDVLTYYGSATDTKIPESLSNYVMWVKPGNPIPAGWFLLNAPTKPGVEVYQNSVPIVTVRRLSLYEDDLEDVANLDNTQQTPPKTYGYVGEWLQGSSSMGKEGRFHVLTTVYKGSKVIDDDIYD